MIRDIFKRILISIEPSGHSVIIWNIDPKYTFTSPVQYVYIEMAVGSPDDWRTINVDNPITDRYYYVDTERRRFNVKQETYYRVVVIDGGFTYASRPIIGTGALNQEDFLLAREIIRKENIRLTKTHAGTEGWLLKRRHWGERCTECTDFDTKEVVNTKCSVCYGTGFVEGYYKPICKYFVSFAPGETSSKDVESPLGTRDIKQQKAKAIAFPILETYDIFVEKHSNKRYTIRSFSSASEIRGIPLIYDVLLMELPGSGIEYQIPMEVVL